MEPPQSGVPRRGPPLRRRRIAWALVPLLAGLGLVLALAGYRVPEPAPPRLPPLAAGPAAPAAPLLLGVSASTALGRGGTLSAALDRLSIDAAGRRSVLETAGRLVDLRRLAPETTVAVVGDPGLPGAVVLRFAVDRYVEIGLSTDHRRAELVSLPVLTRVERIEGVVEESVARALAHADFAVQLTAAFADIVQWDVDLLTEPRVGDRVSLVYEERRLGAVPEDLPPFGDGPSAAGEPLGPGRILAAAYEGRIAGALAFRVEGDEGGDYFDESGRPLRKSFLKSPLNYRRISSRFSRARRNPVTRKVVPHHGVDYAAAPGTPVVATADGRVSAVGWSGPLGRAVRIRHGSEYETVYGHLQSAARGIRKGRPVRQNEVIGYVGSTGRATGPHLHYTLLHRGTPIDPLRFDNPPGEPLPDGLRPRLEAAVREWSPLLAPTARAAVDAETADAPTPGVSGG